MANYIHKDHLGSIVCITSETGAIKEQFNYDPWGRRRNPADWSFNNVPAPNLLTRGFTGHELLEEFALINMNGRVYDPVLGLFLSPDNYVQAPENSLNFNRYSYCLNNPLMYTDPSGNMIFSFLAAIFFPPLVPYAAQLDFAWMSGGLNSYMNGGSFWSGALNGGLTGVLSIGIGLGTGYLGNSLCSGIGIEGAIGTGLISGGMGFLSGGFGSLVTTGEWNWTSAIISGVTAGIQGGVLGYERAEAMGLNPWTGGINEEQRAIWLAYKKGDITLEEAMKLLHPELSAEAGCPNATVTPGDSRATTYPIDPKTGKINKDIVAMSRDYSSVRSEIQFHNAGLTSGRRFLMTSYHELTHAKLFFNGDMHNYYEFLKMNYNIGIKTNLPKGFAYYQAGLKIYAERWAYGLQWARYGINGSRINYVDSMWKEILLLNPNNNNEQYSDLMDSF